MKQKYCTMYILSDKKRDVGLVVVVAFSSLARILGECSTIQSPPAPFLGQDQSTVAKRAEKTVTECSLTSFV